ncbi:MAG: DUF2779 domain-containing protein [Armatimonadetes bacterium]|nr:DUF2779 domain-containing protein [Armatimonadota bacterium]
MSQLLDGLAARTVSNEPFLTKSLFLAGIHCVKRFYLEAQSPELKAVRTAGETARMRTGLELGALARELFPTGVLVESRGMPPPEAAEATQRAIQEGAHTLFEATFAAGPFVARCDVLEKTPLGWRIIEVKSATKVKDDHVTDLAFQWMVLERAGLDVSEAAVCRVDSSQSRSERQLDLHEFFAIEDVTQSVRESLISVATNAEKLVAIAALPDAPEVAINLHCSTPNKCPFYDHCHQGVDIGHVVYMPGIRRDAVVRFYNEGIDNVRNLGPEFKLSAEQARAAEAVAFNQPRWDEALLDRLEAIQFPAAFVDFEATNPALPVYPGMRPYESFPFQWSVHRLDSPFGPAYHSEFLHREASDPRETFSGTLLDAVRGAASVVFYSSYELSTVKMLADKGSPNALELHAIFRDRGVDLLKVIRECVYFPAFHGSFSIKKVLPAVVPDLSYERLEIRDGDSAAVEYLRMVFETGTADQADRIADALLAYCKQDTYAMVRLYQELLRLTRYEPADIVS